MKCKEIWGYWDAVYFSGTVITTIGYGQIAPNTTLGRIFCVVYSLIGICLFVVFAIAWINIIKRRIFVIKTYLADRIFFSAIFSFLYVGMFILFPAFVFYMIEGWSYTESMYYTVVTLTTVGFGDFVPGKQHSNTSEEGNSDGAYHTSAYSGFGDRN